MNRRAPFVVIGLLLTLGLFRAPAATHTVRVLNYYFTPTNLTINVGDTVVWRNDSSLLHDSTHANENSLWSGFMRGFGDTTSYTFTQPGEYPYVCLTHVFTVAPQQTGLVTVVQANLPPSVQIATPTNESTLPAPALVTIQANASDADGSVTNVEFFANGVSLGVSSGPAFTISTTLTAGDYTLTAVARDNQGASANSSSVTIHVVENTAGPRFPLTLSATPPNGGIISASPTASPEGYASNAVVTLTASATNGFVFGGWAGAVTGTQNPIEVRMDSARSVTANFSPTTARTFVLSLITNPVSGGTIGASPAPNAASGTYTEGTIVSLTAAPRASYAFKGWSGAITSAQPAIQITMDSDKVVAANFELVAYTLALSAEPAGSGTFLVAPPSASAAYPAGATVLIAANPNRGFRFVRWTDAVNSTDNPLSVLMNGNKAITASFEAVPFVDFAAVNGSYAGLLMNESAIDFTHSGNLSLRVSKSGAYRGTATIGGMRQGVAGQFDRFGYAPIVLRRGSLSGSLQIEGERISGTVAESTNSATTVALYRVSEAGLAALAGNYNLTVSGATLDDAPPLREGSASVAVNANGAVHFRGKLGDGTTFVGQSRLTSDGRLPLAVPLYRHRGSLIGWLNFNSDGSVRGTAHWMRPGDSRSADYPAGFAVEITMSGSRVSQ